jgi:uncharacterized membrane protein YgcG
MNESKLLKHPLIIAVISALIGVAIAQAGTYLYDKWQYGQERESGLNILKVQLTNQKDQLKGLENYLGTIIYTSS